jgi:hypothetical protein
MNTDSTFELKHKNECFEVSFYDYFSKRYSEAITQKKQPMIKATYVDVSKSEVCVEESKSCYLVPELCHLVGISEQMRNKRFIWREIKQVMRVDAPVKIERMKALVEKVFKNEKSSNLLKKWGLKLSD